MSSIKSFQKIRQKNEHQSMIKNIISPRTIAQVSVSDSQPLEVSYIDSNPPPQPVDQFMPYLSKKIAIQRKEKIDRIRSKKITNNNNKTNFTTTLDPQLSISSPRRVTHSSKSAKRPPHSKFDFETSVNNSVYIDSSLDEHIRMESTFDKIASGSPTTPLPKLIETTLQLYFLSEKVLFFHDIPSIKTLYCPSTMQSYPHGAGVVGYIHYTRRTEIIPVLRSHAAYSSSLDSISVAPDSQLLFDSSSSVVAVVLIIRCSSACSFSSNDTKFVDYFQSKCKMYSRWLFQPSFDDSVISTLTQASRIKPFIQSVTSKLADLFGCKIAEIWSMDKSSGAISKYTTDHSTPTKHNARDCGIAGFSLRRASLVSCSTQGFHSAYNVNADGSSDLSVLSLPVNSSAAVYAIVLH